MTLKLESLADLAKGLGGHFKKMAEHHAAKAEHHLAMHKAHAEHSAFTKGLHEGMDDGDAHKAYFGKVAELHAAKAAHHDGLHKLHKDMAAHHAAMAEEHDAAGKAAKVTPIDLEKKKKEEEAAAAAGGTGATAAAAAKAGDAVTSMIDKTTEAMFSKALETIATSGKIEELVEQIVLKRVSERLGNMEIPTSVKLTVPGNPQLIRRPGQPTDDEKAEMPAELAHFVGN